MGESAHSDWIFDQTWLDDQFLVSGSRDGTLAMWRVTEEMVDAVTSADHPSYHYSKPLMVKKCKQADRVRSLCYNNRSQVKRAILSQLQKIFSCDRKLLSSV